MNEIFVRYKGSRFHLTNCSIKGDLLQITDTYLFLRKIGHHVLFSRVNMMLLADRLQSTGHSDFLVERLHTREILHLFLLLKLLSEISIVEICKV